MMWLMSVGGTADIEVSSAMCARYRSAISQRGTKLIGQCRNRYNFHYEVGMRECSNPD